MSIIEVKNLTFSYDGTYDNIFENVSFRIDTSWRLGFIGRNGRGKTTFLKLLTEDYSYKGTITSSVNFEYFPHHVADIDKLTSAVIADINPDNDWAVLRELNLLGVDADVLDRPFCTLSNGERTKVLLAALFSRDNNFLLLDEPTNHLDTDGREAVAKYLSGKSGFILVSHDRTTLDRCVDHVLSINRANIDVQRGNFSSWYANKEAADHDELIRNEKLKGEIKRLETAAKQSKQWADKAESMKIGTTPNKPEKSIDSRAYFGEKSRRMQQRRKNLERRQNDAIAEKTGLLKNIEEVEELKLTTLGYFSERLIYTENLSASYGDKNIFSDIGFTLNRSQRLCIEGKNGCGKSTLLKLILGEETPGLMYTGKLSVGSQVKISYVPQDTSHLHGTLFEYADYNGIDEVLFLAILRKLDFERVQFTKDMNDFSGGQKKKVLIARSLCEQAHLYIWDEPLNFIDVLSRIQIEKLLIEYQPTMIFIEHDRFFCDKIATNTLKIDSNT